jgi:hypothetical protein
MGNTFSRGGLKPAPIDELSGFHAISFYILKNYIDLLTNGIHNGFPSPDSNGILFCLA